jgi:hypothetical protein
MQLLHAEGDQVIFNRIVPGIHWQDANGKKYARNILKAK